MAKFLRRQGITVSTNCPRCWSPFVRRSKRRNIAERTILAALLGSTVPVPRLQEAVFQVVAPQEHPLCSDPDSRRAGRPG